ncbi:hypothetical protein LOK74_20820 [Brevibacillus humidisoli]|uniref:hypothetical protein n=1 Tax=Brevibacillus humidisoli TaxID=2895522 RepID=UPI001E51D581|nr:hypothetical protein [Brevibacillus humidisoli]UFJ40446.1 hypothetical protein LOK74_20820 [Brevibacillus humidisoli]
MDTLFELVSLTAIVLFLLFLASKTKETQQRNLDAMQRANELRSEQVELLKEIKERQEQGLAQQERILEHVKALKNSNR